MHGYHFTSLENWRAIQRDGKMTLDWIDIGSIREVAGVDDGIWMYNEPLQDLELLGCLIWLMGYKKCSTICELRIGFLATDMLQPDTGNPTDELRLTYRGSIGCDNADRWDYVKNKHITILRNPMPVDQIKLNRAWSLNEIMDLNIMERGAIESVVDVSSIGEQSVCSL